MTAVIRKNKNYLGREEKTCKSLGKPCEYVSKNEGEEIDIYELNSMVGKSIFHYENRT